MKSLQTLALLIAFLSINAFAVTLIKESRPDEDIKFITSPGGVPTEQGKIDGATGNLGFDDITNAAGVGAPNFPFGATGISASITDFSVQSIADPTLTLNGGTIRLGDNREILTYDGTGNTSGDFGVDITANLDTVLGSSPANATTYYLYIQLGSLTETILSDNNRAVYGVTQDNLLLTTNKGEIQGTGGYVYLATITSATTGNSWSGAGSSFVSAGTKSYQRPNVNVSPTVFELGKQSVGHPGIIDNDQGALENSDFSASTKAFFHFNGDSLDDSGGGNDLTVASSPVPAFDQQGFFGRNQLPNPFDTDYAAYDSTSSAFAPTASTSISYGGWFKFFTTKFDSTTMVSKAGGPTDRGYNLATGNDDTTKLLANCAYDNSNNVQVGPVNDNVWDDLEWHHYTVVCDVSTTTAYLYIDGKLRASTFDSNLTTVATSTEPFQVGVVAADTPDRVTFQDVFYTEEALSANDVNAIYSKRFSGKQIKAGHVLTDDSFSNPGTETSYYNLDDVNDDSSNSRTLTNEGSLAFTGSDIFGVAGIADFDGVNDLLSSTDTFFNFGNTDHTLGFWIAPVDWSPGSTEVLVQIGDNGPANRLLLFYLNNNGLNLEWKNTSPAIGYPDATSFAASSWHHVAIKYVATETTGYLYVDGILVGSNTGSAISAATVDILTIGARENAGRELFFNGKMQDVFFANKALTDAEIRRIYSAKITHSKSVLPQNQQWYGTFFRDDNGTLVNELDQDFLLDKKKNFAFIDTGLLPEDLVIFRLQNQSQNTTSVQSDTWTTGLLSSDPGPVTHDLPCNIPADFYVLLEGATKAGGFDKRYDLCTVEPDKTIDCTLPTVDASHRVIIEASCNPIGTSVDVSTNPQMLIQRNQSTSNVIVPVDHSLYRPDVDIQAAHTYTINGRWNSVGKITGSGTINGSGKIISIEEQQTFSTDKTFEGDVTVKGTLFGGSPVDISGGVNLLDGGITTNSGTLDVTGNVEISGNLTNDDNFQSYMQAIIFTKISSTGGCASGGPSVTFENINLNGDSREFFEVNQSDTPPAGYKDILDSQGRRPRMVVSCGDAISWLSWSSSSSAGSFNTFVYLRDDINL